jgi:hypothetical protein
MTKVKENLFTCVSKHHDLKTYCGVEVHFHAFLTSARNGDKYSFNTPGALHPRKEPTVFTA